MIGTGSPWVPSILRVLDPANDMQPGYFQPRQFCRSEEKATKHKLCWLLCVVALDKVLENLQLQQFRLQKLRMHKSKTWVMFTAGQAAVW